MHLHSTVWSALGHPSVWAGIAGVLSTTGAELDKPYSTVCYLVSGLCSLLAVLIRAPLDNDEEKP